MDLLSYQDTPVHRLDPRAKLVTTLVFLLTVISFGKYEISVMLPFLFYPVYLVSAGNIPAGYLLKKVLYASPFAIMVGIFNPVFDHTSVMSIGGITVSGGWISFFSIMMRFFLTVGTALAFIMCTGFYNVCYAIERVGVPRIFAVQLLFLYRYIFVLAEEGARMLRAKDLRTFNERGTPLKVYGSLLGHLLLRTINRAERIYNAMVSRGFEGRINIMKKYGFGWREWSFITGWCSLFILLRFFNLSQIAGIIVLRLLS